MTRAKREKYRRCGKRKGGDEQVSGPEMKRLKLRAAVLERVTGNAGLHERATGEVHPALVEIEQDDGGYYLFYLDGGGQYLAHTWYETLEDAKKHAHVDLAVQETEWASVSR